VHHQESVSNVVSSAGIPVWYHCPVVSCVYHSDFGVKAKHFPKLKYLKQHYLKVHAARSHACDCGQAFSTEALLARHRRTCGVKLLCVCGSIFNAIETLQTHARRSGHTFHHSTVQALRARKSSLGGPALTIQSPVEGPSQAVWTHHIPLKIPCVDVGVQTETEVMRRSRRKSSSPAKCWKLAGNNMTSRNLGKRKRTTETQTRLTHRDSKRLQGGSLLQMSGAGSTAITSNNENDSAFIDVGTEDCNDDDEGSFESLALQVNLPEFITTQQSTSGTQTSPGVAGLSHPQLHNLAISLFDRACGEDEPGISPSSMTAITATQTPEHLDPFTSSQLFIDDDDDDDLLEVVNETVGARRPPSLGHIRSSSIETQTDHDVLLSKNADTPDDADEIIVTTTETQTDPSSLLILNGNNVYQSHSACQASGSCQVHESDSLWCTSETQTYEDFSDIEQFMRSTIHTQTPDHSHSELFPELSFTHTQTQTSLDDPPALVTTHTQTPTSKQVPSGLSHM
ncbi:hypothetical protein OTU49_015527, partial [Cherax quadricarinatus]